MIISVCEQSFNLFFIQLSVKKCRACRTLLYIICNHSIGEIVTEKSHEIRRQRDDSNIAIKYT